MYFSFETNVNKNIDAEMALEHMENWNAFLQDYNMNARKAARGAFHASELWVKAESQSYLITSTLQTLLILLVLAFLGMLAITRSSFLSFFVVMATLFVVAGL